VYLTNYLGMLRQAELDLANGYRQMADGHGKEPDIYFLCRTLASQCEEHAERLEPFTEGYGEVVPEEADRLGSKILAEGSRGGGLGLMRDLQDLYVMASFCYNTWTMIGQAAQGTRDPELIEAVENCEAETVTQMKWIETRMKQAAPQALIVAS
jgi:hypothetical protein